MTAIDLRSDTVTLPTERMRARMATAELGDDARDGDPTVQALEALAAKRTGKEAALFVPSGSMANLVALLSHTGRGGEVLLDADCHIARSEMGGIAGLAGLFHRTIPAVRGAMDLGALAEALSPGLSPNRLGTALVTLETTHNAAGGTVLPLSYMAAVARLARDGGVPVHIDGARLFNAAVALGVGAERVAAHGDSVCFCISKGLSAPVGSLLCGSAAFIQRARAFRRMVGGNLRQAGTVAAAGIVALEEMIDRLAEDHASARHLALGLARLDVSLADPGEIESNIVNVELAASRHTAAEWVGALKERGLLVGAARPFRLRLVTHRHIGPAEVERAIEAFAKVWKGFTARQPAAAV
ncbi:MAG: GntG family PLP-dependent aldolase [Alphaproteobacteria bacterium]